MKGIMFTEDLFKAVIIGRKIQTRRLGGLELINDGPPLIGDWIHDEDENPIDHVKFLGWEKDPEVVNTNDEDGDPIQWKGEYPMFEVPWWEYEVGYFRPRYKKGEILYLKEPYFTYPYGLPAAYKYTERDTGIENWKNKMFMPEKYARYFIQIITVGVQRLQDITNGQAWCEGVSNSWEYNCVALFKEKWLQINGKGSWEKNPWVWVYTFNLVMR